MLVVLRAIDGFAPLVDRSFMLPSDRKARSVDGGTNGFALTTDTELRNCLQHSSAGLSFSERYRSTFARSVDGDANERSFNSAARSTDSLN